MANCNCNCNSNCNNNCNCNCSEQVTGCFTTSCGGFNTPNCSCTPCTEPVIVQTDPNITTQVLIPVVADVIQNCMTINRYEAAFPTDLLFLTNFSTASSATPPSGTVCITAINYSYDCVGVDLGSAKAITGFIDNSTLTLSPTQASCSCGTTPTILYNQFSGTAKTNACCCNQTTPPTAQQYASSKIVETDISFAVCNLNITIQGTIGGCPFTGTLAGTATPSATAGEYDFDALDNPITLETFGFPSSLNFAGRMCLPTCTRLNINEQFDNCLTVDCIRPASSTYTNPTFASGEAPAATGYYLIASGDLSLIINKQIYATTTESLAVLTNQGAQVVCNNGTSTIPTCPTSTPCANATSPCPAAPTTTA